MTFHIKAEQAAFKFTLVDGLPVATVERWGNGFWIVCCPLCGYIHNLPANVRVDAIGKPFTPNCVIAKTVHRKQYHKWIDMYPQSAQFDAVTAILRPPRIIPLDTPAQPVKQPLIAAGKAA